MTDVLDGVLGDAGYELADPPSDGGAVRVYLPDAGDDGAQDAHPLRWQHEA